MKPELLIKIEEHVLCEQLVSPDPTLTGQIKLVTPKVTLKSLLGATLKCVRYKQLKRFSSRMFRRQLHFF